MRSEKGGRGKPDNSPVNKNFSCTSCCPAMDTGGSTPEMRVGPEGGGEGFVKAFHY